MPVRIKPVSIRALMAERGYKTQVELAKAATMQPQHINRIMRNAGTAGMTLKTLERLCAALDCQPGDILEYKAEP